MVSVKCGLGIVAHRSGIGFDARIMRKNTGRTLLKRFNNQGRAGIIKGYSEWPVSGDFLLIPDAYQIMLDFLKRPKSFMIMGIILNFVRCSTISERQESIAIRVISGQ